MWLPCSYIYDRYPRVILGRKWSVLDVSWDRLWIVIVSNYREVAGQISLAIITSASEKGHNVWKPRLLFLWPLSLNFPSSERSSSINTSKVESHVFSSYKWQLLDLCVRLITYVFNSLYEVFTNIPPTQSYYLTQSWRLINTPWMKKCLWQPLTVAKMGGVKVI